MKEYTLSLFVVMEYPELTQEIVSSKGSTDDVGITDWCLLIDYQLIFPGASRYIASLDVQSSDVPK